MEISNTLCTLLFLLFINFSKTSLLDNNNKPISSTESIIINNPLLGVNGTGQLKNFTKPETKSDIKLDVLIDTKVVTETKKNGEAIKKYVTPPPTTTEAADFDDLKNVDISDNETISIIKKHNFTVNLTEENHSYYNSTLYLAPDLIQKYWTTFKSFAPNNILSASHRRAMTVRLSFDFPFYGSLIRNITVATGGFIYTGEYVHSWLAATQYIAPLMANFDTRIANTSFVRYADNGTAFTAVWDNVYLQDKPDVEPYTFSATLHNTGDIIFAYFKIPVEITAISDDKHPVKVGLSDAYITDEGEVTLARKKTIYEYHRVHFEGKKIESNTIIYLKALPTCLSYNTCERCTNNDMKFDCFWCPILKICSTGTDRKTQIWNQNCLTGKIKEIRNCPGYTAVQNKPKSNFSVIYNDYNNTGSTTEHLNLDKNIKIDADVIHKSNFNVGISSEISNEKAYRRNFGLTIGFLIPICLIMTLLVWVLYAYRNPHSKSGQLLIQYRPSQWSWRRGEARYTAATIHM